MQKVTYAQGPDLKPIPILEGLPEKPWTYAGLSVQGVSPFRLTPVANPDIPLTPEFRAQLARKNLVRLLIEPRTATAMVGHGLRQGVHTVGVRVQVTLTTTALERAVVNLRGLESLTPTVAPHSDIKGAPGEDVGKGIGGLYLIDNDEPVIEGLSDLNEDMDVEF